MYACSMDVNSFSQSPFAVLTFIAAPAVLTNATSVLAMSTINRMLRTRDRMHELYARSEAGLHELEEIDRMLGQVDRVERQASLLLRALHSIYVALGAFAAASLVTLLGAVLQPWAAGWLGLLIGCAMVLGFLGVGGLVVGCWNLLSATQISLENIREEAGVIRARQDALRQRLSAQR